MKSENEFSFGGVKYVAVQSRDGCQGCAFAPSYPGNNRSLGCLASPNCSSIGRQDGMDVAFVEVEGDENHEG